MREGSDKRPHRRFHTSKRICFGLSKPIGVQVDELCLLTTYTERHILRYEEGLQGSERGARWRRVVDTNTPDLILGAGEHVEPELGGMVAMFILFGSLGFMIANRRLYMMLLGLLYGLIGPNQKDRSF